MSILSLNIKSVKPNIQVFWPAVAAVNLFGAWYILQTLKTSLPVIDTNLARIYFGENGLDVTGLKDEELRQLATEYKRQIERFFFNCEVQRCQDLIDRFGKVGCDPHLTHDITLPLQCKQFFLELIGLYEDGKTINLQTKEYQSLDGLLDSLQVNNINDVLFNRNGYTEVRKSIDYHITPEQLSTFAEIVRDAVVGLYRPSNDLDETHEDKGTKLRKIINYLKVLALIVTRDEVCYRTKSWQDIQGRGEDLTKTPLLSFSDKDLLFQAATNALDEAVYGTCGPVKRVQSAVAQYGSLDEEHAICLLHDTNTVIDMSKVPQTRTSSSFKFLCCQEYIAYLDEKIKEQMMAKTGD